MTWAHRIHVFVAVATVASLFAVACGDEATPPTPDGADAWSTDVGIGFQLHPTHGTSVGVAADGMSASDGGDAVDPSDAPATGTPNDGWIGGACEQPTDCTYEDAICLTEADGYHEGMCTLTCDRLCPDRPGDNSVTFCAAAPDDTSLMANGICLARCDTSLYPSTGCREGYTCRIVERYNEPGTQVAACLRDGDTAGMPLGQCLEQLDNLGIAWRPWDYTTQSPEGRPDLTCEVTDPVRVDSPINGIDWRYYSREEPSSMAMACELALAMHRLGDVLQSYGIRHVLHIGTFNCRTIGDSDSLSQHGLGKAVDIWGFEGSDGSRYVLEEHWEHDTTSPVTHEGQVLWEIAQRMHEERIFNIVLTPNRNAAHDNHFHVDLKDGSHFIQSPGTAPLSRDSYYIGPNHGRAGCFDVQ